MVCRWKGALLKSGAAVCLRFGFGVHLLQEELEGPLMLLAHTAADLYGSSMSRHFDELTIVHYS